jgi:hypothetical protein
MQQLQQDLENDGFGKGGKKKEKIAPFCTLRIHYNLAVLFFFLLFILTDAPPLEPNPKTLAQFL